MSDFDEVVANLNALIDKLSDQRDEWKARAERAANGTSSRSCDMAFCYASRRHWKARAERAETEKAVLENSNNAYSVAVQNLLVQVEKLNARAERAEAALKPFADEASRYDPDEGDDAQQAWVTNIAIGQLRVARAALKEKGQ